MDATMLDANAAMKTMVRRVSEKKWKAYLQRLAGEAAESQAQQIYPGGFAHVRETGGARRTWLRGLENVAKRYSVTVAAHNLWLMMRVLFWHRDTAAVTAGHGSPSGRSKDRF